MLHAPTHDPSVEPALLLILDGLVRRDGASSGRNQEVCFGVRRSNGYRWWRARLGPRAGCGFIDGPSPTAHATLCLSESDAQRLLHTGRIAGEFHVKGDPEILGRFLKRYTSKMSHFKYRMDLVKARRGS